MFITVRFGDDKSEIFNPDCRNVILLHNIKERCDCDIEDTVDLSDETGNVMNLLDNPTDYGKHYLTERAAFILVRVERDIDGDEDKLVYHPLLQGMESDKDFLDRLNPKPASSKPASESINGKGAKEYKLKNDDSAETLSFNSKDPRRRGGPQVMTGSSRGNKQQSNTLRRVGTRGQLGRR